MDFVRDSIDTSQFGWIKPSLIFIERNGNGFKIDFDGQVFRILTSVSEKTMNNEAPIWF